MENSEDSRRATSGFEGGLSEFYTASSRASRRVYGFPYGFA